jgi:hypothetical protein
MNLTDEQTYQLSLLPVGQAVLFQVGGRSATQVALPPFKDVAAFAKNVSDQEVRDFTSEFRKRCAEVFLPFPGCKHCPAQCRYDELTEAALNLLGSEGQRPLEEALRKWWHQNIAGVDSQPPYAVFERALQRVQRIEPDPTIHRDRAFCAITKTLYRYLQRMAAAQFIPAAATDQLHQISSAAIAKNSATANTELTADILEIGQPLRGFAPFEGCEHCRLKCLLRGEALRAIAANRADSHNPGNATAIANQAWEIAQPSLERSGLDLVANDLVYCIAIQLCEASGSQANRSLVAKKVKAGLLKFAGCVHCPSRCEYGNQVESSVKEILHSGSQALTDIWRGRFGKPREVVVDELRELFVSYASTFEDYERLPPDEQKVMAFCASLHARALTPILHDSGAKAENPEAWWGDTMVQGFALLETQNRNET